ncbi:hypothetical protein [Nonomuraea sp. NPDC050783]|uniref:hypothetical protein n=1 Tax=Nonomuraea sp. NPDC050783 TaxID=3154634 RepID=UPI0034660E1F
MLPTSTRPRPYSQVFIYPSDRLRRMLGIEGEYVRMDQGNDEPHPARLLEERFGERRPRGIPGFRVYVPNAGMTDAPDPLPFKVPIADVPEFTEPQVRMWGAITGQARRNAERASRPGRMGALAAPAPPPPARPYDLSDLIDGLQEDPATGGTSCTSSAGPRCSTGGPPGTPRTWTWTNCSWRGA